VGHKATGVTQFFAAPGGNARMWQGGSSVEAPVLDFDRTKKTLLAHGTGAAGGLLVKTVLVEEKQKAGPPPDHPSELRTLAGGPGAAKDDKASSDKKKGSGGPVRVLSREMFYADATREVEFRGQVQVNDQDGMMLSSQATVYLTPKGVGAPADAEMSLGGKVDHMVATGNVELEQPGRKGWGEKLVYTASDRVFVLTGTKSVPPKVVDEVQGTVTGASLRFRSGDDSVEVLSGDGVQKVHTETRMKGKD
jgi:lipopolysaccharide export system protein LptA